MKITFINETNLNKIDSAILIFQRNIVDVLDDLYRLKELSYFYESIDTNKQVVRKFNQYLSNNEIIKIKLFKPFFLSPRISYVDNDTIYISKNDINSLTNVCISGIIAHKIAHIIDYNHPYCFNRNLKFSVPFFIELLVNKKMNTNDLVRFYAKNSIN